MRGALSCHGATRSGLPAMCLITGALLHAKNSMPVITFLNTWAQPDYSHSNDAKLCCLDVVHPEGYPKGLPVGCEGWKGEGGRGEGGVHIRSLGSKDVCFR